MMLFLTEIVGLNSNLVHSSQSRSKLHQLKQIFYRYSDIPPNTIPMNFVEPFQTLSGQSGNITRKGQCRYTHAAEGGSTFDCIEKEYSKNSTQFENAKLYLRYLQTHAPGVGPHVYHSTSDAMYMEFIDCSTLRGYLDPIDLTRPDDRQKFETAVSSVKALLRTLSTLRLCHNDLHADNILMCCAGGAKLIDIDDMSFLPEGGDGRCTDSTRLVAYLKAVGSASIRRARSSVDEIVAFVDNVTGFDTFHDPGNFHIRPEEAGDGEMTASDEEFLLDN